MTYELAKHLIHLGFPHAWTDGEYESFKIGGDFIFPALSELIEACGHVTILVWGCKAHGYYASSQPCAQEIHDISSTIAQGEGATPDEAVAKLWIALNKK